MNQLDSKDLIIAAAERPRLKLQPRTKSTEAAPEVSRPSSIFGEAKPVDTAAKEREIEEKIVREREQQVLLIQKLNNKKIPLKNNY